MVDVGYKVGDSFVFFRHGNPIQNITVWHGAVDGVSTLRQLGRCAVIVVCRYGRGIYYNPDAVVLERAYLEHSLYVVQ